MEGGTDMKIRWIGHACFYIESEGVRILTDPFEPSVPYPFPDLTADIVTVSHQHRDHNAVSRVKGKPTIVDGAGSATLHGIHITGLESFHDDVQGAERGGNLIFRFDLEGIRLAHLGDLGTGLTEELHKELDAVEVLMIPVGGRYTIDAAQAAAVVRSLPALRIVFPMHYRTSLISQWPIAPLDEFTRTMDNVRQIGGSATSVTKETLPGSLEVRILDHA
jgi:L-ascorbate metabolism protein UlaG (beta-lactamase superfamily)